MAQEQTAYVGDSVIVLVNVIDSTGSHTAATINTTTTRIDGLSTVPTVNSIATGIYEIVFASVTPAPVEGDRLVVKINGTVTATGTAWTEYGIPVKIVADERGTNNASTFDSSTDQVIVSTNNDKTGYSISGTKTTLDSLNDIAASAIVSGGAITTSGGSVSNVTTVATTTTNTDMRGTDGANTIAPDNTSISAIKTKTDQLTFTVSNQVDANALTGGGGDDSATIYSYFTASNREDLFKADVSSLSTSAEIAALNNISSSQVENAVWDSSYSSHVVAGTFGKLMDQLRKANRSINGEVAGTPTASAFDTNLTGYTTGAFDSEVLVFVSGSLEGEARPILNYNSTNGRITFEEALTGVPSVADEFVILPYHVHPISEIQSGLSTQSSVDTIDTIVDAIKVKTDELTFSVPNKVDSSATITGGGDATAANQTTILGILNGASVVVSYSSIKVGESIEVRQGMDYSQFDGTEISFTGSTSDQWPDLTSATVTFYAVQGETTISKECTVTSPTGTQSFRLELTADNLSSDNAPLGNYRYYIIAVLSSGRKTLLIEDGTFKVTQPY